MPLAKWKSYIFLITYRAVSEKNKKGYVVHVTFFLLLETGLEPVQVAPLDP